MNQTAQAKVLKFSCPVHGQIYTEEVWCRHDTEEAMRRVADAHSAPYGGGCLSPIDVVLVDAGAIESATRHYPGQSSAPDESGAP